MGETDFDIASGAFEKFVAQLSSDTDYNEADTRLKIIDEVFLNHLGWTKNNVTVEKLSGSGFADYVFSSTRRVMIVEAKREGEYFELPSGDKKSIVSLKSLTKNNSNLAKALNQVEAYSQRLGVPYAVVTNGHQFIGFIASRIDGQEPENGKAVIFPSLRSVMHDFVSFWNYFSKTGMENHELGDQLLDKSRPQLPPKLSQIISSYPGSQRRNSLQNDLMIVSEIILEDLTHEELEVRFLEDCYCVSGALSRHSLLAQNIIENRYAQIEAKQTKDTPAIVKINTKRGLSDDFLAKAVTRRPILLLGDVGVGKSTFIRHLIKVDAQTFFQKSLALHVDLGAKTILKDDVKSAIIQEMARILREEYRIDIYDDDFVRAIYKAELVRFSRGVNKELQAIDPKEYKLREINYLSELQGDSSTHLASAFRHIVQRNRQVVIFLDNADQRDTNDQQTVFLAAQEIAENWPVTVFVSLRPETFTISNQEGVLKAYHAKAFTIDPPRIDKVLQKRLAFGIKLATGEIEVPTLKDSTLKLVQLSALLSVMIDSLENSKNLATFIENMAAGNVRQAIDMVKDFFGSGHVNTEKILRITQEDREDYVIPLHEFLRAVIYGDKEYFDPKTSIITNLFDITAADEKEHFLLFIILILLDTGSKTSKSKGFVNTDLIYNQLQSLGFLPEQIDLCFAGAIKRKLIETEETIVIKSPQPGHLVRPTSSGLCHVKILAGIFAYMDAVSVDTPIFQKEYQDKILKEGADITDRIERTQAFLDYLNSVFTKYFDDASLPEVTATWRQSRDYLQRGIDYIRQRVAPAIVQN